jgi:hypothetical protein
LKKATKEIEGKMLVDLNSFMEKHGVKEIVFGKSHSIKRSKSGKAIPAVNKK